jgi:hypothetical protein
LYIVKTENNIVQELQQLGCQNIIGITQPYTVPDNYFDQLPAIVTDKVLVGIVAEGSTYTVANTYFTNLANTIVQRIQYENELHTIAPTLASLKKNNVFTTPENYFEQELIAVPIQQPTIVVPIYKKWIGKLAIAASFVAVIALGGILFFNKPTVAPNVQLALQQVDEDAMIQYLNTDHIALVNEVNVLDDLESNTHNSLPNISEADLNTYLKNNKP